jgi:aspartate aminotransferase
MFGFSKAYAMTGWRIGYGAGPKELVTRMARLQSHATSGTPEFCQRAAIAALEGPTDALATMQAAFLARRDLMCEILAGIDGLVCRKPDGAFYVFPDVSAFLGKSYRGTKVDDVSTMAEMLIEHARAAVVPGNVFDAPYAIRFSYACSEDDIRRGLERVVAFFRELA